MRRRGASAAFARNPELQIGFGTLCELILGGLAPKGPNYIHNLPINRILRPCSYYSDSLFHEFAQSCIRVIGFHRR